ncbi:MAG TPA: hypothetical protein VHY58_18195 [Streptosporangiaceae bacterium]|jgi:hypothetical protein|nr:hypothetical protein [Streptosporangiaceae bacterium]
MGRTDDQAVTPGQPGPAAQRVADRRPAAQAHADRPAPYSGQDLRQRLERLPRGHPSCPYNADGSRKPPPPNLRELELPPGDEPGPGGQADTWNEQAEGDQGHLRLLIDPEQ